MLPMIWLVSSNAMYLPHDVSWLTLDMMSVQRPAKVGAPGLVNFITAVAYHFCPSLPATLTQPGVSTFADLCEGHARAKWNNKNDIHEQKLLFASVERQRHLIRQSRLQSTLNLINKVNDFLDFEQDAAVWSLSNIKGVRPNHPCGCC